MDIYAIRKQNLINLIGTRRKNACALKWEMAPAHLSQILSDRTEKNLGDDVARRIESLEGLERGWMDQLRESPDRVDAVPAGLLVGADLGAAIEAARIKKGITKKDLAAAFGIAPPSVQGWVSTGRIDKAKLIEVIRFFSDVVGPEHWGLSKEDGALLQVATSSADSQPPSASDMVRAMLATKAGKALSKEARDRLLGAAEEPVDGVVEPSGNVIRADFSRRPMRGDEISIAHYDVRGAMGSGKVVRDYPEMFRDVIVSEAYLRELGVKYQDPAHLKMITGDGESMAPTIKHLDPLIVDASIREFTGDGIYAFTYQGLFYIKRLQMRGAEHFKMISDNPLHPPEDIRIEETYIQARVLLVWNARRV